MMQKICVFCGSRVGTPKDYRGLAAKVGTELAKAGHGIVYGGGDIGLMGAVADAAMASGGKVYGYIPERLLDREVGHRGISNLKITTDMFDRKRLMVDDADAFLALPGGLGTLDEILDVVTLRQLGYHDKPIVLLDVDGFWSGFSTLVDHIVRSGFADAGVRDLYENVDTTEAAIARFSA